MISEPLLKTHFCFALIDQQNNLVVDPEFEILRMVLTDMVDVAEDINKFSAQF